MRELHRLASVLRYPDKVYTFRYKGRYLHYDVSRQHVVSVNEQGNTILDCVRSYSNLDGIVKACAQHYGLPLEEVRSATIAFLAQMLDEGFLRDSEQEHDSDDSPDESRPNLGVNLKSIYLHLTNACNQRCWYCYNQTFRKTSDSRDELGLDEYKQLLDSFAATEGESVIFTGGEPLLSPHLFALAKRVKRLGLRSSLLTNGTLFSPENASALCTNFDQIIVSLDSKYRHEHDALRGQGTFDRTVAGIKALTAHLRENPDISCELYCRPVITRENASHILEYPQFIVKELGCTWALPNAYVPTRLEEYENGQHLPFREILPLLLEFRQRLERLGGKMGRDVAALKSLAACAACSTRVSIAPNGSIFPCQSMHHQELALGNVRDGRLEQVVAMSPVSRFFHTFDYTQIESCRDCALGPLCGGGCRAMAYDYYHDLNACNKVSCRGFREELEYGLWQRTVGDEAFGTLSGGMKDDSSGAGCI